METTMNNLFKAYWNQAVANEIEMRNKKERELAEFLDDLKIIKKNLEDAFAGTPITVEMGMFGVQEPQYTTIRIYSRYGCISGITSNKAIYRSGSSTLWDLEDKDFRIVGVPYTYEGLFMKIAKDFPKTM